MKQIYSFLALTFLVVATSFSQCIVDANAQTFPGVSPLPDQLPCIVSGVPYDQTLQGQIQTGDDISILILSLHVDVDSISLDSIAGLPSGITWTKTPDVLLGGGNGCINLSGTTNDPVGRYNLTAYGRAWLNVTSPLNYPYAYNGNLNRFSPFGGYFVTVINQGEPCVHATGINDFSADLNTAFSVYPNPSNGVLKLELNAGKRIVGEIVVIDMTGRNVFSQTIDVEGLYNTTLDLSRFSKGLYTVQLRTNEGFSAKKIIIE